MQSNTTEVVPSERKYATICEEGGWRIAEAADKLIEAVDKMAARLRDLDDGVVSARPAPGKWSIKEIIGHLIDSASNNHQRFVRAQATDVLVLPGYGQDFWVDVQAYVERPWPELLEMWRLYNRHLAHVMRHVHPDKLEVECRIGPYDPAPLGFVIEDYVAHLRHHLRQIEARIPA